MSCFESPVYFRGLYYLVHLVGRLSTVRGVRDGDETVWEFVETTGMFLPGDITWTSGRSPLIHLSASSLLGIIPRSSKFYFVSTHVPLRCCHHENPPVNPFRPGHLPVRASDKLPCLFCDTICLSTLRQKTAQSTFVSDVQRNPGCRDGKTGVPPLAV